MKMSLPGKYWKKIRISIQIDMEKVSKMHHATVGSEQMLMWHCGRPTESHFKKLDNS